MIKSLIKAALITTLLLNIGCVTLPPEPAPNDPAFAPVVPSALVPPKEINGAIYQANTSQFFFTDRKAQRVGDILTVILSENTRAIKESETEISKENTTTLSEPNILGKTNIGLDANLNSSTDFIGTGDSDLRNSLQGNISVSVVEVFPNGVMRVAGEKWMRLNRGDEYIRIAGLVRPEDIRPDNTINSMSIADARIAYSQTGELADANRVGWLSRFFASRVWPF